MKSDLIECVIGIGKNLFFNSPMEAYSYLPTNKAPYKRPSVIYQCEKRNDSKECRNYLEEEHIQKIAKVYNEFIEEEGFSAIATIDQISEYRSRLSIPLYVSANGEKDSEESYSLDKLL